MFDAPDLGPCLFAPFVAVFVGILIYFTGSVVGTAIEAKTGKHHAGFKVFIRWFIVITFPFVCVASIFLEIGVFDPAPWFMPSRFDIVGEWMLAPDPTDELPRSKQEPLPSKKIVLNQDGTCRAEEIPDMWSYTDAAQLNHVSYISGSCTWYLGQVQGSQRLEWTLFTKFREINGKEDSRLMRYYFQGHLPPYRLATLDSGHRRFRFDRK
jgi:hypothetical protein